MKSQENRSSNQQPMDEPRPHAEPQTAAPARQQRAAASFVDPYDMRAEPQPEEPGYGHGV